MQRRIMRRRLPRLAVSILGLLALVLSLAVAPGTLAAPPVRTTYDNPLELRIPGDGLVESCADPSVIRGQQPGDTYWYMYCTTDPLNDEDRNASGGFNFHLIPMFRSLDLVTWTYLGDAFSAVPSWGEPSSGMWAPEIAFSNGRYYLYYGMTNVKPEVSGEPAECGGDNAIGVATSTSPTGPWTDLGEPVVGPRRAGPGCNFFWTFDPEVLTTPEGARYLFYGSYFGGVEARPLAADGFSTGPTATPITIPNRYEGPEVIRYGDYYYLFVSATNCCNGPLTGYSVFVGRSANPLGPYVDREGVSLLDSRVGGTPALSMNGNRWVGPGHNTVFQDYDGQYWTIYHAVDQEDPYFEGAVGFTKRPALLDPVDWVDGWPTVRGGLWASDEPMPAPAAQPHDRGMYKPDKFKEIKLGRVLPEYSDEFNSTTLSGRWEWVRPPDPATYGLTGSAFRFDTQGADLFVDNNSASVLTRAAPDDDYVVETKVTLNLPAEGCCFNYVQAGLVVYGDDNNYVKLTHVSIWETRQTEFAKELFPVPEGYPRYGNTVVGPPNETTWLRIARHAVGDEEHYTAYTSRDGITWVRGGTWTHTLGDDARIGLVSMGGTGFTATFDYVRVYRLKR